ncbi:hypothetical protein WN944_003166 [Citrus x changshan-huyou]|uniref:Uncharacterized protein n=1 Tax=Citrus x changshan-huyou TaxID=2935761 RepID=A0AAP0M492_9ROSI
MLELIKREKETGIIPDQVIGTYMKLPEAEAIRFEVQGGIACDDDRVGCYENVVSLIKGDESNSKF